MVIVVNVQTNYMYNSKGANSLQLREEALINCRPHLTWNLEDVIQFQVKP